MVDRVTKVFAFASGLGALLGFLLTPPDPNVSLTLPVTVPVWATFGLVGVFFAIVLYGSYQEWKSPSRATAEAVE